MTLARTIIESFATKEAERGFTAEYVGTVINCQSIEEMAEEVAQWVHETEGDLAKAHKYIFSVLDTIQS
jgi:hypothetical protein